MDRTKYTFLDTLDDEQRALFKRADAYDNSTLDIWQMIYQAAPRKFPAMITFAAWFVAVCNVVGSKVFLAVSLGVLASSWWLGLPVAIIGATLACVSLLVVLWRGWG